jgi:hypothetical protein
MTARVDRPWAARSAARASSEPPTLAEPAAADVTADHAVEVKQDADLPLPMPTAATPRATSILVHSDLSIHWFLRSEPGDPKTQRVRANASAPFQRCPLRRQICDIALPDPDTLGP